MVERAVVVTRQIALVVLRQTLDLSRRSALVQGDGVDVETAVVDGGHERQPPTVGGEARLDIDRTVACQGPGPSADGVQEPELERVVAIGGKDDDPTVGSPVGLMGVSPSPGDPGPRA